MLRAKIDMASGNINLRDPVLYRILHAQHPRTGTAWSIYPSYDFAHGQSDAIEGITHSICTLEFEDHRPLYDWFLENLPVPSRPHQYEFARLNLTYTVLSKRVLTELVREGHVSGWDDPRMPTLAGLRRRGVPPAAIREFVKRIGVAKANSVVDVGDVRASRSAKCSIETRQRRMAVLRPLQGHHRELSRRQERGARSGQSSRTIPPPARAQIRFGRELYIERDDFMENPPKKFFRLAPGARGAVALCLFHHLPRGGEGCGRRGRRAALHLRSGDPRRQRPRRPQGAGDPALGFGGGQRCRPRCGSTISCSRSPEPERRRFCGRSQSAVARSAERLPGSSRHSRATTSDEPVQFERQGYFCRDQDNTAGRLVFNRTVGLRDSWAKVAGGS